MQGASDEIAERTASKGVSGPAERFLPDEMRGRLVETEHLSRYVLAAALARGRTVLDAACGDGYGTRMIAATEAKRAVGIDIDPVTNPGDDSSGAEFVVGDVTNMPFADGEFDLVVSFETVEHVATPEGAIAELARVTDPTNGVLVLSSPNRGVYPPGNEFHQHELTADELARAIGEHFANVRVLRQHNWVATAILSDDAFAGDDLGSRLAADVRKLWPAEPGQELYSVVLASNAELPDTEDLVLITRGLEVREWIAQIEAGHERADAAERELVKKQAAFARELEDLTERLAWVEENELYLKPIADRSRLLRAAIALWARTRRLARKVKQRLAR